METQPIIMVQISDHAWTMEALHSACKIARNTDAVIVLLQMIPIQYPSWLGSDLGYSKFDYEQQAALNYYEAMLEDYGVHYSSLMFQYESLVEGLAQAAEHVGAQILFAHILDSNIPFWTRFQKWSLQRRLRRQGCRWYQHPVYDPKVSEGVVEEVSGIITLAHRTH